MAESSIISHKVVEDSELLFHASKHTNIQKSIAAHKNYILHETDQIFPVAPASEIPFSILPRGSVLFGLKTCQHE